MLYSLIQIICFHYHVLSDCYVLIYGNISMLIETREAVPHVVVFFNKTAMGLTW